MKLRIINNGHTIQVNAAPGSSCVIGGTSYELQQFHFHHPSEHLLSGKPFDLECHLVHRSAAGDFAVIGVFIKAGENNAALEPIWRAMPRQAGPEQDAGLMIDAGTLLPTDRSLFRYYGLAHHAALHTGHRLDAAPPTDRGIAGSDQAIRGVVRRPTLAPHRVEIAASCCSRADMSRTPETPSMNNSSAADRFIADRSISTKVGLGFACVLVLLAVVSGTAYLSFQTSSQGFNTYVQRVAVVGIAREVERSFLNMRRYVREFALADIESNVEAANKEQAVLQALFQQGLAEIKNPERHRQLDDAARNFEAYWKDFGQLVAQRHEQEKLINGTIDPTGASSSAAFRDADRRRRQDGRRQCRGARQ